MALKMRGWAALSQEQRSSVRQFYPELARSEAEKQGERVIPSMRKLDPGGELRDDLTHARKAANEAGGREEDAAYEAKGVSTQGFANALQEGLDKFTAVLTLQMAAAVGRVERQVFQANNGKQ